MPNEPKFFQVATEGPTLDGRQIKRAWIEEAAQHYDPRLYAARINIEHLTSYLPESPFRQYGDVLALKAEELSDGPLKGRMALFAKIDPRPDLVTITNKLGQKLYTSIEVYENFAGTGHAYVTGIAVTDTPASVGTERLKFNAQHGGLVSAACEIANPFLASTEADNQEDPYMKKSDFIASLKALFTPGKQDANTPTPDAQPDAGETENVAPELEALSAALSSAIGALKQSQDKTAAEAAAVFKTLADELAAQKAAHAELVAKLAQEPAGAQRKPATGAADDLPDFL
ncbi:MAG: GPO family capsid scaffolding protein [Betaproteobacteria bacterium]|nr:GPO family capsid scaffolding protein [Betaproteobacteria bacterium]